MKVQSTTKRPLNIMKTRRNTTRKPPKEHEAGSHEKAGHHAHVAQGHHNLATHHADEAAKHHAEQHDGSKGKPESGQK